MIITGALLNICLLSEVDYWRELKNDNEITAQEQVYSTLLSMLGLLQAALSIYMGYFASISEKNFLRNFCHEVLNPTSRLFRGFDDEFLAPHSRHTEIHADDIYKHSDLQILAACFQRGRNRSCGKQETETRFYDRPSQVHDRNTLDGEYKGMWQKALILLCQNIIIRQANQPPKNTSLDDMAAHAHLFAATG